MLVSNRDTAKRLQIVFYFSFSCTYVCIYIFFKQKETGSITLKIQINLLPSLHNLFYSLLVSMGFNGNSHVNVLVCSIFLPVYQRFNSIQLSFHLINGKMTVFSFAININCRCKMCIRKWHGFFLQLLAFAPVL